MSDKDNLAINIQTGKLELTDITLSNGIRIDTAEITIIDLKYDTDNRQLYIHKGDAAVVVSAANLVKMLNIKFAGILDNLSVVIDNGLIKVNGGFKLMVASMPVEIIGEPIIKNESELHFKIITASPVEGIIKSQVDQVNPVLNLNDTPLPIPLTLKKITADKGFLTLYGEVRQDVLS